MGIQAGLSASFASAIRLRWKMKKLQGSQTYPVRLPSPTSFARVSCALAFFATILIVASDFVFVPYQLFPSTESDNDAFRNFGLDLDTGTCQLWRGEWIPDQSPPLYSESCPYLGASENCIRNGRLDRGYFYWRWKPADCELARFDADRFLTLLRTKKLVLIGDSLARNQMETLVCTLAQVEDPLHLHNDFREQSWHFSSYNFTLAFIFSPFLVNYTVEPANDTIDGQSDIYKLHLDIPEWRWVRQLTVYDFAIVSTGYWYHRRCLYYVNSSLVGGNSDSELVPTIIKTPTALGIALRSALKHITTEFGGITMLRTVTVDHFENGQWFAGGTCNQTSPHLPKNGAVPPIPWMNQMINIIQIEEFNRARASMKDPTKLYLLNVTYSMHLRPDGHPDRYRLANPEAPPNDCLHWCEPGPVDLWNQFVLHTLQNLF
ncbi:hypothetical protein KP509_16G007700 [Ceratopteris richardii]|uniref:Trichome birefringence-like N-terminal domain-containing protein n=1 Tax=Ceratopteris richardii TaxID=49495 RepID=A0A8T2SXZ0_CERRI|nr:hypothetical protein KP509_16G007700 [Ceratopteris richardii]